MKSFSKLIFIMFAILVSFMSYANNKITVFAAASLTNAMQDIANAYQKNHQDTQIVFSFASSSILAKQIEKGAPADIFISADQKWMNYLIQKKLITNKTDLLENSLVLIAPANANTNSVIINNQTDWSAILPAGERIAVGDPSHVPAGLYAKESLTHLGVFDKLSAQFAPASNVRDALMLVERNEAALGIVYSTDAKISQKVKILGTFPADSFTPIIYPATLINSKANGFYQYLNSSESKLIFAKYGFITQ